ncbi:hypothetical protein SAMN04487771_101945 [[Clostridium] aminophilum]|uniref:Uncharacterized protein n=1 Tax=[Clostridium] aminophilum TaxID=1526 RepID=A0A1I0EMR7_9FIRM|nr:hypothetical protein [[Clostridium] aminophilum]SET46498.1 hypothetical protein SAMN04487771_101945 [[Clostridium] aminophilum]
MDNLIPVLLIIILVWIAVFLILRAFWCWYWKINARLEEQKKTNELLQNILNALIQGNAVNAVTAGNVMDLNENQAKKVFTADIDDSDIPEL